MLFEGLRKVLVEKKPSVREPKLRLYRRRNAWKLFGILMSLITVCTVGATLFYTLSVPMTFKVSTEYGLVLKDASGNIVTNVDFGTINKGQSKTLTYYLWNTGNPTNETVTWVIEGLDTSAWSFTITNWSVGTNKTIAKGASLQVDLVMTEVNAIGGIQYTATLKFNVV